MAEEKKLSLDLRKDEVKTAFIKKFKELEKEGTKSVKELIHATADALGYCITDEEEAKIEERLQMRELENRPLTNQEQDYVSGGAVDSGNTKYLDALFLSAD